MAELDPYHVDPTDEGLHPHDDERWWSESLYLDFVDPDAGIAGYVRLGILPNQDVAWYWACLVGPDRPLVTVIDHDVPLPRPGSTEVRTEGLWADYTVETPLEHVSVGVEAFATAVDDPADVYGDLRGARVPLGFDLEWETAGGAMRYPGLTRYEVPSTVHGEVAVGDERIEISGTGQRDHSWGTRDWFSVEWSWMSAALDDGTRLHGTQVNLGDDPVYGTGFLVPPGGTLRPATHVARDEELGDHGFPTAATWRVEDVEMSIEPVAFSPVDLHGDDGAHSRFPRAWCRYRTADGREGHGWTEWNQVR